MVEKNFTLIAEDQQQKLFFNRGKLLITKVIEHIYIFIQVREQKFLSL